MKKIIASLMTLAITTTATTTVVACGKPPMHSIDTKFGAGDNKLKYSDYSDADLINAYNGTTQTPYGTTKPLNDLLYKTINLFSLTSTLFTNPKKVPDFKTSMIGMDENLVNESKFKPSVDGLYFDKFEDLDPTAFYANYEKTHINSLAGLYELYNFVESGRVDAGKIGTAAKESLDLFSTAYESSDSQDFINSFLSLNNQSVDSSWVSQSLSSTTTYTMLDSQVLSYNIEDTKNDDQTTTSELQFAPTGTKTQLGTVQTYQDINTNVKDVTGHDDEKVGDRYKAPFDLLMLPTDGVSVDGAQASFDTTWSYPDDDHKDEVDGNKEWLIRHPEDGWQIKASATSDQDTVKGYIKTNESIIVPLAPLTLTYVYSTNAKDSQAEQYEVSITLNNIKAVFSPRLAVASVKDADQNSIGNRYAKWQFTHYQFSDQVDTFTQPGIDQASVGGSGNYSDIYISDLEIQKITE